MKKKNRTEEKEIRLKIIIWIIAIILTIGFIIAGIIFISEILSGTVGIIILIVILISMIKNKIDKK